MKACKALQVYFLHLENEHDVLKYYLSPWSVWWGGSPVVLGGVKGPTALGRRFANVENSAGVVRPAYMSGK